MPDERDRAYTQDGKHYLVTLDKEKEQEGAQKYLPMPPAEGPPLPRALNIKWPWKSK
jgi:hypothetical protein